MSVRDKAKRLAWGLCAVWQAFCAVFLLGQTAGDALAAHYWYAALHVFFAVCCALWAREIYYKHLRSAAEKVRAYLRVES